MNPFVQPHVRPTTSTGHIIHPTHSTHTQTDHPFGGQVTTTDQNAGQSRLNQPSISGQHTGLDQNWTGGQPQWWGKNS